MELIISFIISVFISAFIIYFYIKKESKKFNELICKWKLLKEERNLLVKNAKLASLKGALIVTDTIFVEIRKYNKEIYKTECLLWQNYLYSFSNYLKKNRYE